MATWAETDPRVRQQYGREITKISTEMNWWNKFINNSETAIIMTDLRAEKPEGGTVRIYFRDDIEGDGVFGNQNFDENRGKQNNIYNRYHAINKKRYYVFRELFKSSKLDTNSS